MPDTQNNPLEEHFLFHQSIVKIIPIQLWILEKDMVWVFLFCHSIYQNWQRSVHKVEKEQKYGVKQANSRKIGVEGQNKLAGEASYILVKGILQR